MQPIAKKENSITYENKLHPIVNHRLDFPTSKLKNSDHVKL